MGMVLDKASMQFSLEETEYHDETPEAYAVKPYPPGSWEPAEVGALIAPRSRRLPFARRRRTPRLPAPVDGTVSKPG